MTKFETFLNTVKEIAQSGEIYGENIQQIIEEKKVDIEEIKEREKKYLEKMNEEKNKKENQELDDILELFDQALKDVAKSMDKYREKEKKVEQRKKELEEFEKKWGNGNTLKEERMKNHGIRMKKEKIEKAKAEKEIEKRSIQNRLPNSLKYIIDSYNDALEIAMKTVGVPMEKMNWKCEYCNQWMSEDDYKCEDPWEEYDEICETCEERRGDEAEEYMRSMDLACIRGCCACCGCTCDY